MHIWINTCRACPYVLEIYNEKELFANRSSNTIGNFSYVYAQKSTTKACLTNNNTTIVDICTISAHFWTLFTFFVYLLSFKTFTNPRKINMTWSIQNFTENHKNISSKS